MPFTRAAALSQPPGNRGTPPRPPADWTSYASAEGDGKITMRTSDFDYDLPQELIAQTPIEPRDSSRLLALHRDSGRMEHRLFRDLLDYLRPGDVMVFNQSRVIPARLHGRRKDTGGRVELLLLRQESPGIWQALGRPGRRLRPGVGVLVGSDPSDPAGQPDAGGRRLEVEVIAANEDGTKTVRLSSEEGLDRLGEVPLPPYIHQRLEDPERYQTVYARHPGSAAAPTAGLHFTGELMERVQGLGVELAYVTLHVGLDTFRPVHDEDPQAHRIHTEYFALGAETAETLERARSSGRRVIAVGTTTVRVLEQVMQDLRRPKEGLGPGPRLEACSGLASLFILPGHRFRLVDAMITNFHLPRSTLLMLVSAFAGRKLMLEAYREAIRLRYRFYSFGDAMLLL